VPQTLFNTSSILDKRWSTETLSEVNLAGWLTEAFVSGAPPRQVSSIDQTPSRLKEFKENFPNAFGKKQQSASERVPSSF
jgi:hypothetical protein